MSDQPAAAESGEPRPAQAEGTVCELPEQERAELARERAARAEAEAAVARLRAIEYVTEAALSNLPLEELLYELLRRIRQLLGGDAARLFLVSEDGEAVEVRAFDGLAPEAPEDTRIPLGRGIAGRIASSGQPLIIDDTAMVEVVSPALRKRIKSLIGTPLIVEGRVIGVVDVGTVQPHHFGEDDLRLLRLVADRTALAIESARLYHQARFEQARWRATVESMLDPVSVADAEGRVVYMNAASQRYMGGQAPPWLGPEEYPGYYRAYHPDGTLFRPADLPLQRAALRGEEVRNLEIVLRAPTGEERIAIWNAAPLREDGRITGAVAVGRDVTQERHAEAERGRLLAEVQQRAAELEATIASVASGLIIYDRAGDIVRMNPAADAILGYAPQERRRPIAERLARLRIETPDGRPVPVEETPPRKALRGETVQSALLVIHPPAGEATWVSASAAPIRTPDGRLLGAVLTFVDVTPLHELQEQREDILRAVSHDLRNPLAVVQAQAEILLRMLDKAGLSGPPVHSAEAVLTSARRMNAMIQELVESVRMEAGQLGLRRALVDLRAAVEDLRRRLAGTLETERIHLEAPEDLPRVLADPDRLDRILVNLLSNALKYSAPASEVTVTITPRNGEVVTSVRDRGPGIPPEQLPHVFERYFRGQAARARREGLGLGLYITKGLVEAHGGRIWAESRVGEGSTFSFTLPAAVS